MKKIIVYVLVICFAQTAHAQSSHELIVKMRSNGYNLALYDTLDIPTDDVRVERVTTLFEYFRATLPGAANHEDILYRAQLDKFLLITFNAPENSDDVGIWLSHIANDPRVETIRQPPIITIDPIMYDAILENASDQWHLKNIHADEAHARYGYGSPDVHIVIIDTGYDETHEDLPVPFFRWDATQNKIGGSDGYGHGTAVAGIISALSNNGGITGIAPGVSIGSVKVFDDAGKARWNWLIGGTLKAIFTALETRSRNPYAQFIFNMSLGGFGAFEPFDNVVKTALAEGIVVVAAAGNEGVSIDTITYSPATIDGVIAAAATNSRDQLAPFSNFGTKKNIVGCPGHNVVSTLPHNAYRAVSGTSFASPCVAASLGLALSAARLNPEQAATLALTATDDIPDLKETLKTGGRINALRMNNLPIIPPLPPGGSRLSYAAHASAGFQFISHADSVGEASAGYIIRTNNQEHIVFKKMTAGELVSNARLVDLFENNIHRAEFLVFDRLGNISAPSAPIDFSTISSRYSLVRTFTENFSPHPGAWLNEEPWRLAPVWFGERSTFYWIFSDQNLLGYYTQNPITASVRSEIFDLTRSIPGVTLEFDYFQELQSFTFYNEEKMDTFELYATEVDHLNQPLRSKKIVEWSRANNNTSRSFRKISVSLDEFVGSRVQITFMLRSRSSGRDFGSGVMFGNVALRVDDFSPFVTGNPRSPINRAICEARPQWKCF